MNQENTHDQSLDVDPVNDPPDDPVYLNARREGLVAFLGWVIAGLLTVPTCLALGFGLDADEVTTTFGIPTWVFFGIVIPWLCMICYSVWFSLFFVKDEDLGSDPEDDIDG